MVSTHQTGRQATSLKPKGAELDRRNVGVGKKGLLYKHHSWQLSSVCCAKQFALHALNFTATNKCCMQYIFDHPFPWSLEPAIESYLSSFIIGSDRNSSSQLSLQIAIHCECYLAGVMGVSIVTLNRNKEIIAFFGVIGIGFFCLKNQFKTDLYAHNENLQYGWLLKEWKRSSISLA